MSDDIPLEQIVQELQMVAQQVVSIQTQVRELQGTIDHLSNQVEGNAIFQQVGPLLVEVDDIDTLSSSFKETCDSHLTIIYSRAMFISRVFHVF